MTWNVIMNNNPFQLIPQEDIFDLSTPQLQKQLLRIQNYLSHTQSPEGTERIQQMKELIQEEINQRQLLSQFQKLCIKYDQKQEDKAGNQQFIEKLESFNTQFQELVNQIDNSSKLSLPPEQRVQKEKEDEKGVSNGSMRLSKIKISAEGDQNFKEQQKSLKSEEKQKEQKVIAKPKSVNKSSRVSNKSNPPEVSMKRQKEGKAGTRTSIESDKVSVVSESKPLKLVAKKPPKKVSKKEANDWLVQLVRQEEEKRQRDKERGNNRSSVLIEVGEKQVERREKEKEGRTIGQKVMDTQPQLKQQSVQPTVEKKAETQDSILTSESSILAKEQTILSPANNSQKGIIKQQPISSEMPSINKVDTSTTKDARKEVKKEVKQEIKIDKLKQEISAIKQEQSKVEQQRSKTDTARVKAETKIQAGIKAPETTPIQQSTESPLITPDQVVRMEQKEQAVSPPSHALPLSNQLANHPIHQINDYSSSEFKVTKIIRQSSQESNESDQDNSKQQLIKIQQKSSKLLNSNKACYSEEYWERVRKQALTNLERVKLMKQLRENQKEHLLNQIQIAELDPVTDIQIEQQDTTTTVNKTEDEDPEKSQPQLVQPTPKQVLKINIKRNMEKKKQIIPKKQLLLIKLPEIIPNYLDKYPTFNHIFSVYYNKPQAEALLDIQSLMKQLIGIYNNHLGSITNNLTYKRPMFRVFDNTCMYVNDAHQLLLHAQTTNIDLKTLLNRLNVFNQNLHGRFEQKKEDVLHYRVVKSREEVYDIITTAFLRTTKWEELPHGMNLKTSWNLLWSWSKPEVDFNKLLVFQKVNHFPQNKNISRKDLLYKNLDNFKKVTKASIAFVPLTFNLPKQYSAFSAKFHQDQSLEGSMNIWIMKPIGKSRGRGIKLINNLADLNYLDSIVVQKYLKNPLLLDGYKFDLRVYVLVTSLHPLEVFVYKQGFARLSTQKYVLDPHSIKNTFIHLTNFSIQRNNRQAQNVTDDGGSKITFKVLRQKLEQLNIKWSTIWDKIHQIIIKSLLACSLSMPASPSAFELFGYDVILDTDSNVHLIEINASPSLERSYLIDQIIKQSLIDDIMDLVDFPNFDRQQCVNVMNERLQRKNTNPYSSIEDNIDIGRILKWKPLRKIGEMPAKMGLFERVAPQEKSSSLEKIVSTKYNPNIRFADVWN